MSHKTQYGCVLHGRRPWRASSYGLVCFRPVGALACPISRCMRGGAWRVDWGYSRERLLALWGGRLEIVQLCQMVKTSEQAKQFGEGFLWVLLARKDAKASR